MYKLALDAQDHASKITEDYEHKDKANDIAIRCGIRFKQKMKRDFNYNIINLRDPKILEILCN
jgi:hypothetical protein